jgi:type III pantothenate kinase
MILLLDVGNSRIKWAQLTDGALTPQQALVHEGLPAKEWKEKLFRERFRPTRVLVSNVAGADMAAMIRDEAERKWQVTPEFAASTALASGVTNAYANPTSLGVDRWLAVIAAYHLVGAACVIDAGTAVTVDVVNARGLHLGGLILPGIDMMMNSLLDRTSDLAHKARKRPASSTTDASAAVQMFATNTASAIANGALVGIAAAADRAADEAIRQCGGSAKVLLTGGDAPRLARAMQTPADMVPELVLRGLALQARAAPPQQRRPPSYNRRA